MVNDIRNYQRKILDWVVRHHPSLNLDKRAEFFTGLIGKHLDKGSRVLDVGGGWGFYHSPLKKQGHNVCVLDVVKPDLQKSPLVLYGGEGHFPFKDKSFDVALLITVLHHIPDIPAVIREIERVTRKTLIVVEDVYHHPLGRLWTQWRDQIYNFEFFGHPCQFKKSEEWVSYFKDFGFELKHQEKVHTWLSGLRILNGVFAFDVPDRSLNQDIAIDEESVLSGTGRGVQSS